MSYYNWEKIVSNLSNKELAQLIRNKNSEMSEKVNAAEKELQKRNFEVENKDSLTKIVKPIEIDENSPFLHTKKAVWITSLLGGPLAVGYLMFENYRNLNNQKNAKISLILGIIITILLFIGLLSTPENIIDQVPNQIIPFVYTGIIYLIIKKIFGDILNTHKQNGGRFYKIWRSIVISIVGTFIIVLGLFIYIFTSPTNNADIEKYELLMTDFQQNEERSVKVFSIIESGDTTEILRQLEQNKECWKENLLILEETKEYHVKTYYELLKQYCELRLKSNELLEKSFIEKTYIYDIQINSVFSEMDNVIERIENF